MIKVGGNAARNSGLGKCLIGNSGDLMEIWFFYDFFLEIEIMFSSKIQYFVHHVFFEVDCTFLRKNNSIVLRKISIQSKMGSK